MAGHYWNPLLSTTTQHFWVYGGGISTLFANNVNCNFKVQLKGFWLCRWDFHSFCQQYQLTSWLPRLTASALVIFFTLSFCNLHIVGFAIFTLSVAIFTLSVAIFTLSIDNPPHRGNSLCKSGIGNQRSWKGTGKLERQWDLGHDLPCKH